jgi:hypothetical protein
MSATTPGERTPARIRRAITIVAAAALCTLGLVGFQARLAHAQDIVWTAETLPPEPNEKEKNPPPSVKVKVVGEVAPKLEELANYKLKQTDAKPPMGGVKPTKVVPYHKSGESLAVVVLIEGHEYYFGNDKYKEQPKPACPDCPVEVVAITGGVYETIKLALDAPQDENEIPTTISHAGPPGSKGALIVYGTGVDVRQPMGPLTDLTGDKLGEQERQRGNVTRDLMAGLREAQGQLARTPASRKVLFLISDGVDPSAAPEDFRALKSELDKDKVEVFPLSLTASSEFIGDPKNVRDQGTANLKTLGKVRAAKDGKELAGHIATIVTNEINNRYWLYFPGLVVDSKTKVKSGFQWDEKEHELVLMKGEDEFEPRTVLMVPKFGKKASKSMWWLWLAIPGGLLAIVAAVLLLGGKKQQPAPPPVVVAPPPVVEAPRPMAPVPGGGNKTMAINLSTGDGIPVVGWLVPINGPQAFKTFKLLAGVTKVGNVPGAHIQFDDAFMSAEHAHIVMTPNGFTLADNNATNGTFVNEKRMTGRHELVDNDMVMFGKTSCKFKTIVGLG